MKQFLLFIAVLFTVFTQTKAQTTVFSDDFESGAANFVLTGTWAVTTEEAQSGTNSLSDSPGGNYADNVNVTATLATPLDFSTALDAELNFSAKYDIEDGNFDYLFVEVSTNGGTSWIELDRIFGQGNLTNWIDFSYSLAGFVGESSVLFRFRLFSDGGFTVDGAYIDDVEVITDDTDNGGPLVIHNAPVLLEGGESDFARFASIVDISGIDTAKLIYTVNGVNDTVGGIEVIPGIYGWFIPEQTAGTQVFYFMEVTDASPQANVSTTPMYTYIAGNHLFYDNGVTDFVNSIGPAAANNPLLSAAAVRFTLQNESIRFALIRNYTDNNRPNSAMMFHIWAADENGLPGDDVITPFPVTPEANLVQSSPMTRIDLSAFADDLSDLSGDYFMGYSVPAGTVWLTQTTPGIAGRTFTQTATGWAPETDDYHFRLVTSRGVTTTNDSCSLAADLSVLLGGPIDFPVVSGVFDNTDATPGDDDGAGFECFFIAAQGNPVLENTQWFTFVGDGGTYEIRTDGCGSSTPLIDAQIALYSGDDCNNLTPVGCNDDEDGDNNIFTPLITTILEDGVTYYLMIDGYDGEVGEYCVNMTQINTVTCADLAVSNGTAVTEFVCLNDTLRIAVDGETVFPVAGEGESAFRWIIHAEDPTGSDNPFALDSYFGAFGPAPASYGIAFVHTEAQLPAGVYFFTPIAYNNAIGDGTGTGSFTFDDGCFIMGETLEINLLPALAPLSVTLSSTPEDETIPELGSATATVTGGSGGRAYLWSNGETTQTITGLVAGEYTVTVSDLTGCVDDVIETVVVSFVSSVNDPALGAAVSLYPNPAADFATFQYNFQDATDLQINVTNTLGQTLMTKQINNAQQGREALEISHLAPGTYFVRFSNGESQAVKQLVIIR